MARKSRPVSGSLSALSAALQATRKKKNMTQAGLAARTGMTQGHISAIEKGALDPKASTLLTMAGALGCELILVPKERASEALRLAGMPGKAVSPPTLLEEMFVPEPGEEEEEGDGG